MYVKNSEPDLTRFLSIDSDSTKANVSHAPLQHLFLSSYVHSPSYGLLTFLGSAVLCGSVRLAGSTVSSYASWELTSDELLYTLSHMKHEYNCHTYTLSGMLCRQNKGNKSNKQKVLSMKYYIN